MVDHILSVSPAGDAPIRLCAVGSDDPVAEHAAGFDTGPFHHGGVKIVPEDCLTADGLLDAASLGAVGDELWARLGLEIGERLPHLMGTERIYLDVAPQLLHLPWELLRCDDQFVFTAPGARWCLGRPEDSDHWSRGTPPSIGHPLRVLVVVGSDSSDTTIGAAEELLAIERAAHRRNAEVLLRVLLRPTAPEIGTALRAFAPHVLHIIAHGEGGGEEPPAILLFSTETGQDKRWEPGPIRSTVAQRPPRLVVLNACLSAQAPTGVTSLITALTDAGARAVVGMMGKITGTASEAFSACFYTHLFDGEPVDRAANLARLALGDLPDDAVASPSNWPLPRVVARGAIAAAVEMPHRAKRQRGWRAEDFVVRWDERWAAWQAIDGGAGAPETESRLAVLCGPTGAGKSALLHLLADTRMMAGEAVVMVNLANSTTGDWPQVLRYIAEQAGAAGFDAAALLATAADDTAGSTEVHRHFLTQLEDLARPDGDRSEPLLLVVYGLGKWDTSVVNKTVVPLLFGPFTRARPGSRLRMLVSLEKLDENDLGALPDSWKAVPVGDFASDEWARALVHFRDHWYAKVPEAMRGPFDHVATGMAAAPKASVLVLLRSLAVRD